MNVRYRTAQSLSQQPLALPVPGFQVQLFESMEAAHALWSRIEPPDEFLKSRYLGLLERHPPRGMRFTYAVFFHGEDPVGVAYFQISHFRPDRSIRQDDSEDRYPCIIRAMGRYLKQFVASQFDHNLLVCGNLLLTGEHGFWFDSSRVDTQTGFRLLLEAVQHVHSQWERLGLFIDGIFIKDIEPRHLPKTSVFIEHKFRKFTFHPNMVLFLDPTWETFDDYLAALQSKYRVRARRAFKAAASLEVKALDLDFVRRHSDKLFQLYLAVMDNASFNMVVLHERYLVAMKETYGEDFQVTGYFEGGELVGFCTTLLNGEELEAHFLGFDETVNRQHQLYLNMLYHMIEQAISKRCKRLVYARTAMEIKSSVGAVPIDMLCFIKATHPVTNKILPHLIKYLQPPDDWVQRHPFRDQQS